MSMLHGYLWLGFLLHCLMSSVEISRLTGSWQFFWDLYTVFKAKKKKKSIHFLIYFMLTYFFLISKNSEEYSIFLLLFKMNPTEQFKHRSGTRHVSTGFLELLMAEHKQLSLIVFKHFILPHEFFIPQSSLNLQRDSAFVKPKDKPISFSTNLTGHIDLPLKTSFTMRKSASNDQRICPWQLQTPVISCFMSLLSSEQKIPRVPRGPGSQSCGHVPVQVTKNRPVSTDTAYPGLLEPGHSLL